MNVSLIGFMGTGKTEVGKRLAKRLGWDFVDVDLLIEKSARCSIPEIFARRGELVFRRLERKHIAKVVKGSCQVIAAGGGAFVDPTNREILKASGPVVCLTAHPNTILERLKRDLDTRPLLKSSKSPMDRIRTLLAKRAKSYAEADLTLDTTRLTLDQVVTYLWDKLNPYLCQSWQYLQDHANQLSREYGGKYVVIIGGRVVSSGENHLIAFKNIPGRTHGRREAGIYYIPKRTESLVAL